MMPNSDFFESLKSITIYNPDVAKEIVRHLRGCVDSITPDTGHALSMARDIGRKEAYNSILVWFRKANPEAYFRFEKELAEERK